MAHSRFSSVWFTMHGVLWWDALLRMIIGCPPRASCLSWTDHCAKGAGLAVRERTRTFRRALRGSEIGPFRPKSTLYIDTAIQGADAVADAMCASAHIP